jgi:hypothetical protein
MRTAIGFVITFLAGWFTLTQLVTSPPMPGSALLALTVAAAVLAVGEVLVHAAQAADLARSFGFAAPARKGLVAAAVVCGAVLAAYAAGAGALGISLTLRPEWPLVLIGVFLFHGPAEELVWRAFAFRHLREGRTFRRAVLLSMPLIAPTHVPIIVTNGPIVGGLALASAAVTCLPLAYLWERGDRTIWGPAMVHATIDLWQLLAPGFPMTFSVVILVVSIVVPLLAFAFRDRFFGTAVAPARPVGAAAGALTAAAA